MSVTWPSIPKPSAGFTEELSLPAIRTKFENGSVQTSAKFSRARRLFRLSWNHMFEPDVLTLEAFFSANQGNRFTYYHPVTGVALLVTFNSDSIKYTYNNRGGRSVELELVEI